MNRLTVFIALSFAACGATPTPDAGVVANDGGLTLVRFSAPVVAAVNNSLLVTATGEAFAISGVPFPPPASGNTPYFLDGWELTFTHVLVTIGNVSLNENPDLNPNDPSQTGALAAEATGPWAVDLANGGALDSKELNGKAVALARVTVQNRKAGTPAFDATAKYALGYSLVVPIGEVQNVNLDAEAQKALRVMHDTGFTVWMQGVATWRGAACRQSAAAFDFGRVTKRINFSFGFKAPVQFKNCVNPELQPADSRGVQTQVGAQTTAQLTFHLDHPFWEALEEDAPLRFDAIAARTSVTSAPAPASASVTEVDLAAIDFQAVKDAQGGAVAWRTCGPVQTNERTTGAVAYDPVNVPANPAGGAAGLKDLNEYMTYNLSTFGHLNNDGLCFPSREYPSPR